MTWTGVHQFGTETFTRERVEAMLDEVGAEYSVLRLPKNGLLFWEGEPHRKHYFLCEGAVEIYKSDENGKKKSIDFYGPGCFFGYMIFNDDCLPMTSAQAISDSVLIAIPRSSFFKLLHGCPAFADATVYNLYGLLSKQTNEVIASTFCSVQQRLAILLLELSAYADRDGLGRPVLCYGNNEIGDMLGVSRNSVTTAFSRLIDQGVVEKERGNICILDTEKLGRLARNEF